MLTERETHKLYDFIELELKENADLFDAVSNIDSSLTYQENLTILKEKIALFKEKALTQMMDSYKEAEIQYTKRDSGILDITTILKKNDIIGIVGNRNVGKSSLVISHLEAIRRQYKDLPIYTLGLEENLKETLKTSLRINILESTMDILDLNIKNAIIYIDEFALLFSTKKQDKEQDKLMRFFDRISHQNVKLIISTAREGFYNKFMCSRITAFLVKQIEYEALVNGSWLKERVKAINSNSDYRLEIEKEYYYLVSPDEITSKYSFKYNEKFDSKKGNKCLFC